MKTVWVIEQGSYSDYRVVGVFSSKKNAELIKRLIEKGAYDEPTIAEWLLDPAVEEINAGLNMWNVLMLRDGEVERVETQKVSGYSLAPELRLWERTKAANYKGKGVKDCLQATVFAESDTHAIKIVNEHRAEWIASGKWPEAR